MMTANQKRHLYRSRNERIIAGICGGLADYFGLKVFNVRLALFAADPLRGTLASGSTSSSG